MLEILDAGSQSDHMSSTKQFSPTALNVQPILGMRSSTKLEAYRPRTM